MDRDFVWAKEKKFSRNWGGIGVGTGHGDEGPAWRSNFT